MPPNTARRLEPDPIAGSELRSRPRILCFVNHFYGTGPFRGKSTTQLADVRRAIVQRAIASLESLGDIEIKICGVPGKSLLPLDVPFELEDPQTLVYESLARMRLYVDEYDYFINIEDDVELSRATLENILAFDAENEHDLGACLHPNRMEEQQDGPACIDLQAVPGWQSEERLFHGQVVRLANNPHSGLLVLSRDKLRYAMERVDPTFRGQVIGGLMASAYAHWHRPFRLYRSYLDWGFHTVKHLDNWYPMAMHPVARPASGLRFSAVLLSWKRPHNLPLIVTELRRIPEIDEILLWNNDPSRVIDIPGVTVVNSQRNFECFARYALAALARNDNVWFQDDDLLVTPEQFRAVLAQYEQDPSRVYGCRGRRLREGRYVFEEAYGEVDVVIGQTMMFHRSLLKHAFDALGSEPVPGTTDDISFSLLGPRRPVAVNVEPLRDLGMTDAASVHATPGQPARRQDAVERALRFRAEHPLPEAQLAELRGALQACQAQSAAAAQELAAARGAADALAGELAASRAEASDLRDRLAALEAQAQALSAEHAQLKGSVSVRVIDRVKQLPVLYPAYRRFKGLR